ncbi:hypothetical protein FRB90_001927 [Tulasnella sp. 427]|nr:hypothetical protein FRB90_001927 [Tulasnella sp. 427]
MVNCRLVDTTDPPSSAASQADVTAGSRPETSVEPERDQDQQQPSTSSPRSTLLQTSNIAVSADAPSGPRALDHGPPHATSGDDAAQDHQESHRSTSGSNNVQDGDAGAASLTPEQPTTASSAPPLLTSEQPSDEVTSSPPNELAATSADDEARPQHAPTDEPPPLLPVQVFTPLFAALLLSPNNALSDGSRAAVVELLRRLKDGYGLTQPPTGPGPGGTHEPLGHDEVEEGGDGYPFGRWQRKLLERELILGLAIGMARMDEEGRNFIVLSTDGNGTEDMHDVSAMTGGGAVVAEEPIPQVLEDGFVSDGQQDDKGQEGEPGSSAMHGEGSGGGVGLGLVSPVLPQDAGDAQEETEEREESPPLFEEEPPRVQLPAPTINEPRTQVEEAPAEIKSSPASAPLTVTSPSPPPASTSPTTSAFKLSPQKIALHLSPKSGRSGSPLLGVAPISATAHLTHLSPAGSRPGSPSRQSRSPIASAPHTPPSPTMRPVRLPSTESTRNVSIPGTPMQVLAQEDVLGLDTDAELPTPPAQVEPPVAAAPAELPAPIPVMPGGLLGIPMVPEPVMSPGPGRAFPTFSALPSIQPPPQEPNLVTPAPFADVQGLSGESIFRRPVLSPVQPPSDHPAHRSIVPQQPIPPKPEETRSTSYSSEKSESTPTEGSSGETVTPSDTPAGSPTRTRSTEDGVSLAEIGGLTWSVPSGAAPADLEFQSVPLASSAQGSNTVSPSSTDTSPFSSSTHGPQTGFSMETNSSETSTVSAGTMDTRSSSSESVPVHTPEGQTSEDDAGQIAFMEVMEGLEPGRSADEFGIEDAGDENPYFMAASTASAGSQTSVKSAGSDTISVTSEQAPSESPPVQMGSRSAGGSQLATTEFESLAQSVKDDILSGSNDEEAKATATPDSKDLGRIVGQAISGAIQEAGVTVCDPTDEVSGTLLASPPVPSAVESNTVVAEPIPVRPKLGRNRSGSFSGSPSTGFVAPEVMQAAPPLRSRSVGRPDFVPLPPRGNIDSPYPSPPIQDAYAVPPIDFAALFAAQQQASASNVASARTFSPPPESVPVMDADAALVVHLPQTQVNQPSPELTEDPGNGGNITDGSWSQHENGAAVEEPVEYDVTHDAAVGRVASMSLVAAITAAGILSDESKSLFTQEVVKVGQDQVYWVRREAAFALGALAKTVSVELLTSSLLPLYEGMTCDEIANVRQSALFALPGILARLPSDQRRDLAIKQCATLSHDSDRLVRSALLEIMGEMIYCFRDDEGGPPSQLIELFVGNNEHDDDSWVPVQEEHQWGLKGSFNFGSRQRPLGPSSPPLRSMFEGYNDPTSSQYQGLFGHKTGSRALSKARDPERVLICAFNFPAVVAAMGPQRWSELRPYYQELVKDPATKVRKTLAASIGEIARMIGPEHAGKDLVSVWWDLMHDDNAEVRAKVVDCVASFVTALGPDDRRNTGIQLEGLWSTALTGWRDREALVAQFGELSALLTPAGRGGSIKTLLISALTDRTAAVRDAAISSLPKVIDGMAEDSDVHNTAMRDIEILALDSSFRRRATYVTYILAPKSRLTGCFSYIAASQALLLTGYRRDAFEELERQQRLSILAEDSVVDVRIGLSRFISLACAQYFPERQNRPGWLKSILRRLGRDSSNEVKSFVASLARHPSSIVLPPTSPHETPAVSSPFATFSRPPTSNPLFPESLDDLINPEDADSTEPEVSSVAHPTTSEALGTSEMTT